MRSWTLAIGACLLPVLVAGCGSNEVVRPRLEATVGQQLIDLKKARDSGALSEREYEQQRRSLVDSVH
ncbi:SHOCT domain-containing protein [Roseateles albus]|uniref:SHOCT domain-containing protein n=1 Tax=Roseateles albus TaxID=2987525 RepID=A0ABT5KGF2_9BURK|nr:SHOCT domain-containing protein [Roseateles albus]MDC8773004.1 SHOCT domain-containing protein [Roseateles albus]